MLRTVPPLPVSARTREGLRQILLAYDVTWDELTGQRKYARYIRAREAAVWLLHSSGFTLLPIARLLRRDHSSIHTALKRVNSWKS